MPVYYDIHCHVFNKDVMIRTLVNVVQVLISIVDKGERQNALQKLKGINETLKVIAQDSSEQVFQTLDKAYAQKLVVTPLMLDLTYADDNDADKRRDIRYRRRIELIFETLELLLPYTKSFFLRDKAVKKMIGELRDEIRAFDKKFKVRSKEEVEIFDDNNYAQQITDLENMAQKYPRVKPFFCVDPRQQTKDGRNILDILKQKLKGSKALFSGVKLYAPTGFSPTDPVLMGYGSNEGVYGFCQRHKIPITVHCSNSGFACLSTHLKVRGHIFVNNTVVPIAKSSSPIKFPHKFLGIHVGEAIEERAQMLNHPRLWALVFQKFPKLKLNLAHFGGSGQIMEYVNYTFPEHLQRMSKADFEETFNHLEPKYRQVIHSIYQKDRRKMVIKGSLDLEERQAAWNAMYHNGIIINWSKAIFDIIRDPQYPNAYTDLSCFVQADEVNLPGDDTADPVLTIQGKLEMFRASFYDKLSDYEKSKFLYGSDYFLNEFFGIKIKQYFKDFKKAFGKEFDVIASKNPEKFLGI